MCKIYQPLIWLITVMISWENSPVDLFSVFWADLRCSNTGWKFSLFLPTATKSHDICLSALLKGKLKKIVNVNLKVFYWEKHLLKINQDSYKTKKMFIFSLIKALNCML